MKKLLFIALLPILLLTSCVNSLDDYNLNSNVSVPVSVIKDAFDDFDDSFDENEFQKIEFDNKEIKNKK